MTRETEIFEMNIEITGIDERDAVYTMFYHLRLAAACFENTPTEIEMPCALGMWEPAFAAFVSEMNRAYEDD